MSLQIWLPLNGDLHNQGLHGESVFTTNNAVSNDNGKIGKCYSFNGTSSYLIADFTPGTIVPNEMSFCCWIKLNSINKTHTLFSSRVTIGAGLSFFITSSNKLRFDNGNNSNNNSNQTTFDYIFSKDIWYHIAVIQTSTQKKLYINGILQQSINKASANLGSNTAIKGSIGASGANNVTDNYLNGYLNDVRLYNHALSDKEVEEISKGLILHYKLDDAGLNPNLITNFDTSFLTYDIGQTTLFTNQMNNGTQEIVSNIEGAQKCLHFHGAGGQNRAYKTLNLSNGKTYTISLDYYSPNNQPTAIHGELQGGNYSWTSCGNAAYSVNQGKWQRLIYTTPQLTSNATLYYFIHCISGYDCYIKNIKIEEGSFASPWCNYKTDIIYDSSGYNNNGTIIGSLSAVIDSARYDCATNLMTTSSKIEITNLITTGFSDTYTFAWWGKVSAYGRYMMWGFADGARLNGIYYGNLWNTNDGQNNPLYIPGTTTQVTAPSVNEWHHFAMIGNGTQCLVYKDGELWGQAKTYKSISGTTIYLNGWENNTSYSLANTILSDFRIYATALTAAQIKELYNTSATIDNLGNAYARELVEI